MASEIDQVLTRATAPLGGPAGVAAVMEQLRLLEGQFSQLRTGAGSNSNKSSSSDGGFSLPGLLGPGLLLSPLISGVLKLFGGGGGGESEPSPLLKFALPPAVNLNAGVSRTAPGEVFGVDSAQGGLPRAVTQTVAQAPQITVQVQAMDSQSFMDRSGDIARAVRQAMLESSVLNDVVREA